MATKNTSANGLIEKLGLRKLMNLTFDTFGNLRVTTTPTGTQAVTQSTIPWVVTEGSLTQTGTSQIISQQAMQSSFRRNLIVS